MAGRSSRTGGSSSVTVALPHIQAALGFSGSNLEWVVSAYAVAFGGLLLERSPRVRHDLVMASSAARAEPFRA
ncbi:MAG TPA: hypothetical protein VED20_03775, partial [Streptosporangiaceae bacterium]|nr:hypothetical protein [Streptosporangiaceae bacterium]